MLSYSIIAEIISIIFTTGSAIVFAHPSLLKDEEIEKISETHGSPNPYAHHAINPHVRSALILERKMAQYGLFLLVLGVVFGLLSIYFNVYH